MLKLIPTVTRMTAMLGVLAALPGIVAVQRNALQYAGAATAHAGGDSALPGEAAGALGLAKGQAAESQGLELPTSAAGLLRLLSGTSAGPSQPGPPPAGPATVICRTGGGHRGTAKMRVMELPSDANVTFVDDRLQVYYPGGKLRPGR